MKEPVANPNELDTSARTTDDDLNAPPANNDADASAPSPNNAPDASAPSPNSFATAAPDTTAPCEKSISEPVCSLVNSKLAEWFTEDDSSAPLANAEAVASAPCENADADKTAFSPNPFATKSDSSLEEVKESIIKECDTANDAEADDNDDDANNDAVASASSEAVVALTFLKTSAVSNTTPASSCA